MSDKDIENKLHEYINIATDKSDEQDLQFKGYNFSRDADPSHAVNDLWKEEVQAWADMSTIESLFFTEDWVYIVVDLIANKISSQPLNVVRKTLEDGVETIAYADGHPLNDLVQAPNPMQDYHSWMYNTVVNYALLGNAILWYSKSNQWLVSLRASMADIAFDRDGSIRAYNFATGDSDIQDKEQKKQVIEYLVDSIIHIRRPNPGSLIHGLSPFLAGRKSILFNRYSQDYLNQFYLKQATPSMIIEMDKQVNEDQALRMTRSFELAHTGRSNARRALWLPKGMKATTVSHSIADQRLTDLINSNRETILSLLKVPKHEVGLQTGGSLGSEEYKTALRNFWEATLIPTCRMIEGGLNKFFAKQLGSNFSFKFDLENVESLKDDQLSKALLAKEMLNGGMSVNEVRSKVWDLKPSSLPADDAPFISVPKFPSVAPAIVTNPLLALPAAEPTAAPAAPAAETDITQEVADQASTTPQQSLNGAQVTSLVDVVNQVAQGSIPRETGVQILRVAFSLSVEDAEAIMGAVGAGFSPTPEPGSVAPAVEQPPQVEPVQSIEQPTIDKAATLLAFVHERSAGWVDRYVKSMEETVKDNEGKAVYELALDTLISMAELAEPIIKRSLIETKAAEPKSKTQLRRELSQAFAKLETQWKEAYTDILLSTVELGYDSQIEFVINDRDKEKIAVLRKKDAEGRREILVERGIESFDRISDTRTESIMASITQGTKRGESISEIITRVAKELGDFAATNGKAETIARTETLTAVSIGQGAALKNAQKVIPGLRKAWLNAGDARVRDSHVELQAETVAAEDDFSNGLRWPRDIGGPANEVINCFPAGTNVEALGMEKSFQRFYRGPMVTVKFKSGKQLTATPNHPVLSDKGWIGLGSLSEGSKVFKTGGFDTAATTQRDVNHIKSGIDQVFSSMLKSSFAPMRVDGGRADFHRDGSTHDVNIVGVPDSLKNGIETKSFQVGMDFSLAESNFAHGDRPSLGGDKQSFGGVGATHPGISSANLGQSLLPIHSAPFEKFSLGSSALSEPTFIQTSQDGSSRDIKHPADLRDGELLLEVELDDVVSVDVRSSFEGHVYNLQTVGGYYIAEGFVSHNCRCTLIMLPPGEKLDV
jgi:HK97 family phage portal protein